MEIIEWITWLVALSLIRQSVAVGSTDGMLSTFDNAKKSATYRLNLSFISSPGAPQFVVKFLPYGLGKLPQPAGSYISDLVKLFSSRFQYMSVPVLPSFLVMTGNILRNVAEHNKRISLELSARPIYAYPVCSIDHQFADSFSSVIRSADSANEIFPGTVPYIVLSTFTRNNPEVVYHVKNAISRMRQAKVRYQVGLKLSVSRCDSELSKGLHHEPHITLVVFEIEWEESFDNNGVENALQDIYDRTARCKKEIESNPNLNVSIAFSVTWLDTNDIGTFQNQTALVIFWKSVAELGKREGFVIFMNQAFDRVSGSTGLVDSNGWWTTDLQEKINAPNNTFRVPIVSDSNLRLCDFCCQSYSKVKYVRNNDPNIIFNKSLVTLFMDAELSEVPLTENQYLPFAEIVSERFQNLHIVLTPSILEPRDGKSLELRFLKTVAVRNKIHAECNKAPYTKTSVNIEIYLNIGSISLLTLIQNSLAVSDLARTVTKINEISHGTVHTVIVDFYISGRNISDWTDASRLVGLTKSLLGVKNLTLGLTADASSMYDAQYRAHWAKNVFPHAELAYLRYDICQMEGVNELFENDTDVKDSLKYVFGNHTKIVDSFRAEANAKFGIYLQVNALNCLTSYTLSHETAKILWLEANKLAEQENVSLVVGPGISTTQRTFAEWWRLTDSGKTLVIKEYIDENLDVTDDSEIFYTWRWRGSMFIASFILPVFVAVCLACQFLIVMRRRNTQKKTFHQEQIDFLEGKREQPAASASVTQYLEAEPYDSSIEISLDKFSIDTSRALGSGTFGSVFMAQVTQGTTKIWTAAKSLHCNSIQQTTSLRSLLMEIKILSYLGKHPNITELIGAYTSEIKTGKVYVFLELCHYGSLHGYLRSKLSTDPIKTSDASNHELTESVSNCIFENQLLKWGIEIASGMEHISSKFIVHADLATRNVLLDINKIAKICDFGLSRRMENYQNYVKASSEPLPWRWMAYESLTDLQFSTKSDVWSFGVTLWEIYNEGKVPYPGLTWTCGFTDTLESGLCLPKPTAVSQSIYSLMESCWSLAPADRPDFERISIILKTEYKLHKLQAATNTEKSYSDIVQTCNINTKDQTVRYSQPPQYSD